MMYYCFNYKFESNTTEYEENTKPTVNVKVSSMFEFSYRPQVFYDFYWVERRIRRTLNVDRDVDVLVAVFPPPLIWVEKGAVKLRSLEAAIQELYEK